MDEVEGPTLQEAPQWILDERCTDHEDDTANKSRPFPPQKEGRWRGAALLTLRAVRVSNSMGSTRIRRLFSADFRPLPIVALV